MSETATQSILPTSLARVIKYCPRWPEPTMPSRIRSLAPQTRRAAAAVAAPTMKALRETCCLMSMYLPGLICTLCLAQRRDDAYRSYTTNTGVRYARDRTGTQKEGRDFCILESRRRLSAKNPVRLRGMLLTFGRSNSNTRRPLRRNHGQFKLRIDRGC